MTKPQGQSRLREALEKARARAFVGRKDELATFEACLEGCASCRTLLIHGPGGVGKSTLVEAFAYRAREAGRQVRELSGEKLANDARALNESLQAETAELGEDGLLLVDDFEALARWEKLLREEVMPQLPSGLRVVLAGRWIPATDWRIDPGWRAVTRILRVDDFSSRETREYLENQGMGERAEAIHGLTQGHPLAVALASEILEANPGSSLEWDDQPGVVGHLVARHLRDVDTPHQRLLLHAAALPARIDAPMLGAMTGSSDPEADLAWLRRRHFTREGLDGLRMHDLVAEALRVEMGRLEPERHRKLIRRGVEELCRRRDHKTAQADPWEVSYLVRDHPLIRRALPRPSETGAAVGTARGEDLPLLADLVEKLLGKAERGWFEYWAGHQRGGISVLWDSEGKPTGMAFYIDPWGDGGDATESDPVAKLFREYVRDRGILREGEKARLGRFFLVQNDPTLMSPEATQLRSHIALHVPELPGLVFSGCMVPADEDLEAFYRLINLPALEGCRLSLEGRDFCLTGHDWRLEPPGEWLRRIALRTLEQADAPTEKAPPQEERLSRTSFEEALASALKGLNRVRGLAGNPLLATNLAQEELAEGVGRPPEEILTDRLREAIGDMECTPEGEELGRVLRATYLEENRKQLAVAESLGMSFGTYRRRHRRALELLTEEMWERYNATPGS